MKQAAQRAERRAAAAAQRPAAAIRARLAASGLGAREIEEEMAFREYLVHAWPGRRRDLRHRGVAWGHPPLPN